MNVKHLFPLLFLAVATAVGAQNFPTDYFLPPMKIEPSLSATFGEVRANHFHSGLDMRTDGEIGQPVHAPADGYVSRIKVSAWGGGKTLYIDHPNGYRTVYMHLDDFCGKIGDWVLNHQYKYQCFAFDTNIAPGVLPVRQGQLVAHSGNSGGSGGPHLHYEIRYAHNDQTINAQLFGLQVPDAVPPTIKGIRVYPAAKTTRINGKSDPLELLTTQKVKGKKRRVPVTLSPTVDGAFYLGIYATDQSETYSGNNGIYSIDITIDGKPAYNYTMQTFRFEDTRAVNALMDFQHYCRHRQPYILTRLLPYMPPTASQPAHGDGTFYLAAGRHTVKIVVSDFNGNKDSKTITLTTPAKQHPRPRQRAHKKQRGIQTTRSQRYQLEVPPEALYTDDSVVVRISGQQIEVKPAAEINNDRPMPPHVAYTLRVPQTLASHLKPRRPQQYLFLHLSGKRKNALATTVCDKWLQCKPRDFGTFTIAIDTTCPTIQPPRHLSAVPGQTLTFRIRDDLSGIDTYNCYLNGRWILAEYDGKTASIAITLPDRYQPGRPQLLPSGNMLTVVVADLCGNTTQKDFILQ